MDGVHIVDPAKVDPARQERVDRLTTAVVAAIAGASCTDTTNRDVYDALGSALVAHAEIRGVEGFAVLRDLIGPGLIEFARTEIARLTVLALVDRVEAEVQDRLSRHAAAGRA
jgi:hypothetical protein